MRGWLAPTLMTLAACHPSGAPTDTSDWPEDWARLEERVLVLVNQHRHDGWTCGATTEPQIGPGGFAPLEMDDTLREVARLHSEDMAERDFFDHVNPDGQDPFDRMSDAGFTGDRPWGENIEAGSPTPEEVVDAWMHSPEHCDNIMYGPYGVIGVGLYEDPSLPYSYWWTQDFAASH